MKMLMAAVAVGLVAANAEAATFLFSYTNQSGGALTFELNGELQPDDGSGLMDGDNDTIFVDDIFDVAFDGVPAPEPVFIESYLEFGGGSSEPRVPSISISGFFMDLIACTVPGCGSGDGFLLTFYAPVGGGAISASSAFGGFTEDFALARYSVVPLAPAPVPLPSAAALLGGVVILLAAAGRRRR